MPEREQRKWSFCRHGVDSPKIQREGPSPVHRHSRRKDRDTPAPEMVLHHCGHLSHLVVSSPRKRTRSECSNAAMRLFTEILPREKLESLAIAIGKTGQIPRFFLTGFRQLSEYPLMMQIRTKLLEVLYNRIGTRKTGGDRQYTL